MSERIHRWPLRFQFGWLLQFTTWLCFFVLSLNTSARTENFIPLPTPKPQYDGSAQATYNAASIVQSATTQSGKTFKAPSTSSTSVEPLKSFFVALERKNASLAVRLKNALSNPLDREIANWMIATASSRGFSHQTLQQAASRVPHWPGQVAMSLARENALVKAGHASSSVARSLPASPSTDDGKLLQIKSLIAAGEHKQAATRLRKYWVSENFTAALERQILTTYGRFLTPYHHKARANRLLYDERANGALRLLPHLSKGDASLVNARVAVIRRQKNARALLDALPSKQKQEAGYFFASIQNLRRADQWLEAGKVMMDAPSELDQLGDPGAWWIERRMVSRKTLEAGHPVLAYQITSSYKAQKPVLRVDAAFHSGWYALQFLDNPAIALSHFETIREISQRPLSQSRALYWIGRAHSAAGNNNKAISSYHAAAQYPQTYYGQLALRILGRNSLALTPLPNTQTARLNFDKNAFVRVIKRLNYAGRKGRSGIFYRHLAQTMTDPAELTLLASLADNQGLYPVSLQIGKLAVARGIDVPRLAFPLGAVPQNAGISKSDKALAYAIARQESAFNIAAVSSADARGLMQLLPATAKRTARTIGISYHQAKLTSDGAYNARLGSAFLKQMIDRFNGSYILAFAGYNAGPGRSDQWIKRFGDPRRNSIDAVDWVEAIPFAETRNYVQRVMENFQVYRHRLENAPLTITKDLNRGLPS